MSTVSNHLPEPNYCPQSLSPSKPVQIYKEDSKLKLLQEDGRFFAWILTKVDGDIEFLAKISSLPKHLQIDQMEHLFSIREIANKVFNIRSVSTFALHAMDEQIEWATLKDLTDVDISRYSPSGHVEQNSNGDSQQKVRAQFQSWFSRDFLRCVPHLQVLKLPSEFTDLALVYKLQEQCAQKDSPLRGLSLAGCELINDRAITVLSTFSHLEELDLSSTIITDKAIRYLEQLPNLKKLNLSNTDVTDAAVNPKSSLWRIVELNLSNCFGITPFLPGQIFTNINTEGCGKKIVYEVSRAGEDSSYIEYRNPRIASRYLLGDLSKSGMAAHEQVPCLNILPYPRKSSGL